MHESRDEQAAHDQRVDEYRESQAEPELLQLTLVAEHKPADAAPADVAPLPTPTTTADSVTTVKAAAIKR